MENSPIITLSHVYAAYDGRTALEDATLQVMADDFLGIIGPNGAGKTTLVKVILGLLKPVAGQVQFWRNGAPCDSLRTGYLPQYSTFDAKFPITVREVVLSGLHSRHRVWHRFTADDRRKADQALQQMELTPYADRAIGELSGGQRQRVLVARALVCDPEVLILDEPATYIDQQHQERLYQLLADINRSCAVVLVSHDVGTVMRNVKNIACVNRHVHYHAAAEVTGEILGEAFGCPFEMVAHGHVPHRILSQHGDE